MLTLIKTKKDLTHYRGQIANHEQVGLVPTMGNLHEGHLSLVKQSLEENHETFVTIFVNPTQFGPTEDFSTYPRTLEQDLVHLKKLQEKFSKKKLTVFAPTTKDEVYPPHFSTTISLGPLTKLYCGKTRPTHFDGVTTVVYLLFALIRPHKAYFGEKDFQQLFLIKKMVGDLNIPIHIQGLPTMRNKDGLALSSRNHFLSSDERQRGLLLPQTLQELKGLLESFHSWSKSLSTIHQFLEKKGLLFEYLVVLEQKTLLPPSLDAKDLVILGALKVNKTRLIDNIKVHFP